MATSRARNLVAGLSLCTGLLVADVTYAQDRVTLRYGQIASSARNVSSLPLYVAQRKGFLAREAIELQVVGLGGVRFQVEAVDKGDVDLAHTATPYLIEAVLAGSDSVAVVGGPANPVQSFMVKKEIATFSDLRSKLVGVSDPADTITIGALLLLAKHGLKEGEYQTKMLIGPARGECLARGECDAAPVTQPTDIQMARSGFRRLGDSTEVFPNLQFNVIAARRAWAQGNRQVVVRFAKAFGAAYRYMRDPANRSEVAALIQETTGTAQDIALEMLTLYYQPDRGVMPRQAEIDMTGVATVIELLGKTNQIPTPAPGAARFVDLTFLQEAGLQ